MTIVTDFGGINGLFMPAMVECQVAWVGVYTIRLAFQRRHFYQHHYVYPYETVELATGKVVVEAPNLEMSSATSLADGRIMFLQWDNEDFTSSHGLYEMKTPWRAMIQPPCLA